MLVASLVSGRLITGAAECWDSVGDTSFVRLVHIHVPATAMASTTMATIQLTWVKLPVFAELTFEVVSTAIGAPGAFAVPLRITPCSASLMSGLRLRGMGERVAQSLQHDRHGGVGAVRHLAGQQLEQDNRQCIDVGGGADHLSPGLFRRHVRRCANAYAGLGEPCTGTSLAIPKSISTGRPLRSSMMLSGLMARWIESSR